MQKVCQSCMAASDLGDEPNLDEIDEMLEAYRELEKKIEDFIEEHPEPIKVPEELKPFAFTPISMYKSLQAVVADLKIKRIDLITKEDSKARLEYSLKKALQDEDFEKAERLKDKLSTL
ncbi:MAG TPA: hypothetical protein ENJ45_03900 [Phaeodactylibacter sp.]|nr:hypothetical protein [Phaeodactylibacter sp.]